VTLLVGVLNVDWSRTPPIMGALVVAIQGLLHWSVMEIPLQTVATFFTKDAPKPVRADASRLTLCLNYNLLAVSCADIDECMHNMYLAYMGSISENVSATLVSATNDPDLKEYELHVRNECRERIYKELVQEGLAWAGFDNGKVDPGRRERVWSKFQRVDRQEFAQVYLSPLCRRFAREFMVLHRVSRVLRKCGQYQDLMLLSMGIDRAFTYCDESLYHEAARPYGEPLFYASEDMENTKGRHFDYTLVLDADTRVLPDSVFDMLEIGAGNPERAIIQPAIQMECKPGDSIFVHVEAMRQTINEPLTNTLTMLLGESGFYGKGLLKNSVYIEKCLGTPEKPIEVVPIDVLSHDTFEAAVVGPLYAGDVSLLEGPCANYVTWDIRERRWNRGELLLAMYFFPRFIGEPMRWIQSKLQGKQFQATRVRTIAKMGAVSCYLAHAALRQIMLKPLLVFYIILMDFVHLHYEWTPIIGVMFLIIVFPKFATCKRDNFKAVLLETTASILQFTPECVVGTIRILRALKAHLTGNARWVPQRAVEEEFEKRNPFLYSLKFLWYYPCFALLAGIIVSNLIPDGVFVMWMLGTLFTLPLYAGFTALKTRDEDDPAPFPYFTLWNMLTVSAIVASFFNVDWSRTPGVLGIIVVAVQGLLHWSVLEIPLQTLATFFTRVSPKPKRADGSHLTICLNYNLLAVSKADVDECMNNMYKAFMGNISENVSAVLVSATNDLELTMYEFEVRDTYRDKIYEELLHEGLVWAGFEHGKVDAGRHARVWSKFQHIDRGEFRQAHLDSVCRRFATEFMVLHRVSRVLRKCGQYQDLMLLSSGQEGAFTYCDCKLYGEAARPLGEPIFHASADTDNVSGRHFDYTLVLDADTGVVPNSVFEMLEIGAGNPERAIIQPAIQMDCKPGDSIFIHVEAMRQMINAPLTNILTSFLGESGFYGKALIKNSVYIQKCLGTPDAPIEVVPIDVLSHDTFEAAVVGPLYAGDVHLLEAPCGNYVTWDIRERRWNRGELLLAMYFFPRCVGAPMRWLQSKLQGKQFKATKVRTKAELGNVSRYLAHAALRQIVMKPLLVAYIVMMDFVHMYYEWTPFFVAMSLIIVFPKLATCNKSNFKAVMLETTASILQFTPECVVGTIRILRALKAHLTGNAMWIPQRAVEEEFEKTNAFVSAMNYLWYYPCFAFVAGVLVSSLIPDGEFIMWMLGTLFALPIYAGFTALRTRARQPSIDEDDAIEGLAVAVRTPADEATAKKKGTTANVANSPQQWLQHVAIGPRGSFLSAGERAQIALARAAYCRDSELVLLDDPLALVDGSAGDRIMEAIVSNPLFADRARIVAMPANSPHLRRFDRVLHVERGRIVAMGPSEDVLATAAFRGLLSRREDATGKLFATPTSGGSRGVHSGARRVCASALPEEAPEMQGRTRWHVVADVAMSGGPQRLVVAALAMMALRVLTMGQVLLLGIWADHREEALHPLVGGPKASHAASEDKFYVHSMAIGIFIAGLLQAAQNYLVLTFNSAASKALFDKVFSSLLRAPVDSFWGMQPVGRVVNRLSADLLAIDASLSAGILAVAGFIFSVVVQQIYCLVVIPKWAVLPMYLAIGCFVLVSWGASEPLHYFSMMAFSKCHDDQARALLSVASTRAYKQQGRQIGMHCANASSVVKPTFLGGACAKQWLCVRITFCFCFQCTVCMLFGVMQPGGVHIGALTMIALSTFSIIQELDSFVDSALNSIVVGMSLQRLTEYFRRANALPKAEVLQREAVARYHAQNIREARLDLRIEWLRVRYAGRMMDAVGGVKAEIPAGSWLGVVGLPGSGKTALLLGLARLIEPTGGRALLGGVDLGDCAQFSPELFRRLVSYVPQEPAIFDGSVRFNLDPSGGMSDEQIWEALGYAQLSAVVARLPGGLDCALSLEGVCLSAGQQQLLCFARAICAKPSLLLLDCSLSAVDQRTQDAVKNAVAANFRETVVVMASQRMENMLNADVVIVLDNGTVLEQGCVKDLLADAGSYFAAALLHGEL